MAAFGAAHVTGDLAIDRREHLVDPWSRGVDDETRAYIGFLLTSLPLVFDAPYSAPAYIDADGGTVIANVGAGFLRADDVLDDETFGVRDLRIIVLR